MTRPSLRSLALAAAVLPVALGLAACKKTEGGTAAVSGEKIAVIAPPAGKAWSDVVSKTPENGYRMGNPDAPIKLVEYASLTCSHCAEFAETSTAELRDKFVASGRVSYELRNLVRDAVDLTAVQLVRCGSPESFFPLAEQTFANQAAMFEKAQAAGQAAYTAAMQQPPEKRGVAIANMAGLTEFFAARGVSKDQQAACLAKVDDMTALADAKANKAEEYDINATPTFILNGSKIEENTWPLLKAKLETMGAR